MKTGIEKPGAETPWSSINDLLKGDERFKAIYPDWQGFIVAPKTLSRLSALLNVLNEEQLDFHVQNQYASFPFAPIQHSLVISLKSFNQVRLINNQGVEVEAGCDLNTFSISLFAQRYEVGLEEGIDGEGKGTVGWEIIQGMRSGLLLRQQSPMERLLAIEWMNREGKVIKLGDENEGAHAGPAIHRLIGGIQTFNGILLKAYFKVHPLPPVRLSLCWSFEERKALGNFLQQLQQFTSSWERLECVIPGHLQERGLIMAQISGVEEEMEAFKQCCPSFHESLLVDKRLSVKKFLLQQGLFLTRMQPEQQPEWNTQQVIPVGSYVWYHVLTGDCWLACRKGVLTEERRSEGECVPCWKRRFLSVVDSKNE